VAKLPWLYNLVGLSVFSGHNADWIFNRNAVDWTSNETHKEVFSLHLLSFLF
jgi:hypothetical protein